AEFGNHDGLAVLGYEGSDSFVRNWAESVTKSYPQFPALSAVIYFNDREVYPWPDGYGRPDWRVVRESIN
ncbi:beta-mannosidase, partial [Rhizobium ruizarguesonis]